MAELDWSKGGQDKALEFIGKNMLVSASAGSGKTTVMVEKIFRYLETGSITKLIIITFTKASAADMREKLTARLSAAVRAGGERADHYKQQLRDLPLAYIGTIDSICCEIYRRWFEDIGGSPDFAVLEATEADALRLESIKSVGEELIATEDERFKELEERYTRKRGLQALYDVTDKIMRFIDTQEDPIAFLDNAESEAKRPVEHTESLKWLANYYRKRVAAYGVVADKFIERATRENIPKLLQEAYKAEDYISTLAHADDVALFERVSETFIARKPSSKKDAEEAQIAYADFGVFLSSFRALLKEMREVAGEDFRVTLARDAEARRTAIDVMDFVRKCSARYAEAKQADSKADFADLERNALAIVKIEERAKELRENTDFIFLDEYQDTNRLQEAIISRIERGNLFMVGDVKQAIYGFRAAEADIFLERYKSYKNEVKGKNIPLNTNFRSEQRVLSFIDEVFSAVMTYDFGGIDYAHASRFGKAGISFPVTDNAPAVEVAVFTDGNKNSDVDFPPIYSVKNGKTKERRVNPECAYIASGIKRLVSGRTYYDKKRGAVSDITYSDIAVLVRDRIGAEEYLRAFDEYGIPYDGSDMNSAGEMRDIDALDALLRVMDNSEQDYPLVTAMLSYFGGFDESELAEIRYAVPKEDFFYKAVRAYDGRLKPKIDKFYALVAEYSDKAPLYDVSTLLSMIAGDTGFISYLFAGGEYDRIEKFNSYVKFISGKTYAQNLADYLAYKDSDPDIAIPKVSAARDRITVLTIHKSKGLEFPVVFMAGCSRKMRGADVKSKVGTDPELGIAVEYFDPSDNSSGKSLTRTVFDKRADLKSKLEETRIMYVAMTRAKNYLYISGTDSERGMKDIADPADAQSFMDWIRFATKSSPIVKNSMIFNPAPDKPSERETARVEVTEAAPGGISFLDYAYKEATELGTKYTVTALNADEEREQTEYVSSLGTQDTDIGIAYHKVMELIDFNIESVEETAAFICELEHAGKIPPNKVSAETVWRALRAPVFDFARKAKRCRREQEFLYYAPACEVIEGKTSSDKTLVQGVMDLVIEGDKTIIVDYKVSNAAEPTLRERYAKQIDLYARAYAALTGKQPDVKALFVINKGLYVEF